MRISSLVITIILAITTNLFAIDGNMGGPTCDGSAEHPYLIEDFNDFQTFCDNSNYWSAGIYTQLKTDLDLSIVGTYNKAPIAPDGDKINYNVFDGIKYAGHFDGNDHVITNLVIDGKDFLGLFGYIDQGATVSNIELQNVSIDGNYTIGGLAGENYGNITNSCSSGSVNGGQRAGGLLAINNGNIVSCHSTGTVNGEFLVGGLVGENDYQSSITNSYAAAAVFGTADHAGGLVGINRGNINGNYSTGSVSGNRSVGGLAGANSYATMSNNYSTSQVSGNTSVGGLVGYNYQGTITCCYSTGLIADQGTFTGGLIGTNYSYATNCFWDVETSQMLTSAGGTSKTTAQMKDAATFIGFNNGSWIIDQDNDYPRLAWENTTGTPITTDYPPRTYTGSGTEFDPFILTDANDLVCMSIRLPDCNSYFTLANNIDMSSVSDYKPVVDFSGNLDGKGFIVSNLNIDSRIIGTSSQLGLIGHHRGTITNLGIVDCNIISTGDSTSVGGLCGYNGTYIENCYSTGSVTGYNEVGGLCGYNRDGDLVKCYSTANVNGNNTVGGMLGENNDGAVRQCHSNGYVTGNSCVGGLVGHIEDCSIVNSYSNSSVEGIFNIGGLLGENEDGVVNNCYSTGPVTGDSCIGGLIGNNIEEAYVNTCYSTGIVTGNTSIGGLIGNNDDSFVNDSFWDVEKSQINISAGGTGKTTTEMKTKSTFTDAGWDFMDIWNIAQNQTYPYLRQYNPADINNDSTVNFKDLAILANNWLIDSE